MHFSIPDTQELKDSNGSTFTAFNIHVNGVFHCSVRYRQLHNFHDQLKKEFGATNLPQFPPKKLLSLTPGQLEERRSLLERYVQIISQDANVCNCDIFNGFLLSAQQETEQEEAQNVALDIYLMNGHKITVHILSTDQTNDVLEAVASQIELSDDFVYYFALFLIQKDDDGDNSIVRKLQEFESPHLSLKAALKTGNHRIVLRKNYWDPSFDDDLMDDRIAMNLLYVQAVSDIERGWLVAAKDQYKQLTSLQQRGSKKEYLRLARTLKFYGFMQFKPCLTDYPQPHSQVIVSSGNRELNFRIQVSSQEQPKEGSFKVTRMRCWRITTASNGESNDSQDTHLELAFEYLIAKDTLKWITIYSDQAILISMCLQGMVDELIMKKQGKKMKRPQDRNKNGVNKNFMKRDGSCQSLQRSSSSGEDKISSVSMKAVGIKPPKLSNPNDFTQNDAFEGIGDDDL